MSRHADEQRLRGADEEARQAGAGSLREIAAALTERGVPMPSGEGAWTATAVRRVLARAERIAA
jgi:hypothetical protein